MRNVTVLCLLAALAIASNLAFSQVNYNTEGVNVTAYNNQSQAGYKIDNIYTQGEAGVTINHVNFNIVQNYISPNESGITINNVSYYMNPSQPQKLVNFTNFYINLVQVDWIPIQPVVNYTLYSTTTSSTTSTSTTSTSTTSTSTSSTTSMTTTSMPQTSITTPATTSTVNRTTTVNATTTTAQQQGDAISQIINYIISFFSKIFSSL